MKALGCWTSFEYFDYQQTPLDKFMNMNLSRFIIIIMRNIKKNAYS